VLPGTYCRQVVERVEIVVGVDECNVALVAGHVGNRRVQAGKARLRRFRTDQDPAAIGRVEKRSGVTVVSQRKLP